MRQRWRGKLVWAVLATLAALERTAAWTTAWGGVGVGEGNVGHVIKARTVAWTTVWGGVSMGEGNVVSVRKN